MVSAVLASSHGVSKSPADAKPASAAAAPSAAAVAAVTAAPAAPRPAHEPYDWRGDLLGRVVPPLVGMALLVAHARRRLANASSGRGQCLCRHQRTLVQINILLDPAIDVVVTGHTHLPYNCLLNDPNGNPRIVTSAYSFGRVVSEINLVLDHRTGDIRRDLSSATNHTVVRAQLTADAAITAIISKWKVISDPIGKAEVGAITADIRRAFYGAAEDRGSESNAGNMIADAQLFATQANGAQIAFMNPGGIRSDLIFAKSGRPLAEVG